MFGIADYQKNLTFSCCFWQSSSSVGGRKTELRLDGVKDIIAVASGKGGVGKSSTAGNIHHTIFLKKNLCERLNFKTLWLM